MSITLKEALAAAVDRFAASNVGSPRLNAETLLMFLLSCDRSYLYAHPERVLTGEEKDRYDHVIAERILGVPTQYITGHQEFWGLDFIVTPDVLIPRPETELLVETVLALAREVANPYIIDVGTGSGCIALALAKELPQAALSQTKIDAVDVSSVALEIARANAVRNQLADRVDFKHADLLAGAKPATLDFVVSNPPYVGEHEEDEVQLEVRKFEPRQAVFAGATGLEVYERLVPQAQIVLKPHGWLVMEISATVAPGVKQLLSGWQAVEVSNDLQGIPRVIRARKN
ncbi:MAG: peptide chain release factor N(5)-glutamine methyltransferase [Terriglobales bacterium]